MAKFSLLLIFWCSCGYAAIEPHLKSLEHRDCVSIQGIDFVYLINLEQRPEKLKRSLEQLSPFGIKPQRFPAIYGWGLPLPVFEEIGLVFTPEMWRGEDYVLYFPPNSYCQFVRLNEFCYGKTFFSGWLTPGAAGCTLSHLSVLRDAESLGFQTIWILEDDFSIVQDPHLLSERIAQLDGLIGKEWDVLYTDPDYLYGIDETNDLLPQLPMKWRPDQPGFDLRPLLEHTPVGDHFFKIGSRNRTHSMIVRRSGIEKILQFYRTHGIFLPYDHELSFIPGLRFYVVKESIVGCFDIQSDTKDKHF